MGVQPGLPVTGLFPAPLWGTASGVCPLLVVASCCLAVAQVRVPPTGCFPWTPRAELLRTARPRPAPARACPTLPRKQPKTTLLPADFPVRKRSEWLTAALQCCYREGASTHLCPAPRRPGTAPGSGLSASGPARTGQLQLWLGGQGARLALHGLDTAMTQRTPFLPRAGRQGSQSVSGWPQGGLRTGSGLASLGPASHPPTGKGGGRQRPLGGTC